MHCGSSVGSSPKGTYTETWKCPVCDLEIQINFVKENL